MLSGSRGLGQPTPELACAREGPPMCRSTNKTEKRLRAVTPNKSLQRSWTHKVLGRGRPSKSAHERWRARVLKGRRAPLNSAVRRQAPPHQQLRLRALCSSLSASRWLPGSVRVVRGAPTQVAGHSLASLVPPNESAHPPHCRRGRLASPGKRSSIKCWPERSAVSMFGPQVLTAPAAHLHPPWQAPAAQRSLVHCAAASVSASSPLFNGRPFVQDRKSHGGRDHAHRKHTEKVQPALGLSPNKSLQRSGTHKVLGRGRPTQERTRALARPRAEVSACVAELGR